MQTKISTSFLIATVLCITTHAQSPWQGEWGTVTLANPKTPDVQRLDISDCHDLSCNFSISIKQEAMRCEINSNSKLTFSGENATATLPGPDASHVCRLTFHRDASGQTTVITSRSTGEACHSYYCTDATYNKLSFDHTFALRSPQPWFGEHVEECFYMNSPARMATCADPALAKQEWDWKLLYEVFPADGRASHVPYQHTREVDNAILKQCDAAPNPALCLHDRYASDIATMQAHKSAAIDASVERGDPVVGGRLAQKVAGRYSHRFANADVQGHNFTSTDRMTLNPVGKSSISFDIELNFFNGHECSISGGALYRKDGTFVFDDDAKNTAPDDKACRLAILPSEKGIELKDLSDGGCKMYCGARGSLDGASFRLSDRQR